MNGGPIPWREPAVGVIVAAGIVHIVRHDLFDIAVFWGVLAVIVLEPWLGLRPSRVPSWLSSRALLGGGALVVAGVVMAGRRDALAAQVVLALPGVVALVVAVRAGPGAPTAQRTPRLWAWPLVLVAGAVLELADFISQPNTQDANPDHPTLSAVVDPWLADPVPRGLVAGLWLVVGWWLVRLAAQRSSPGDAS